MWSDAGLDLTGKTSQLEGAVPPEEDRKTCRDLNYYLINSLVDRQSNKWAIIFTANESFSQFLTKKWTSSSLSNVIVAVFLLSLSVVNWISWVEDRCSNKWNNLKMLTWAPERFKCAFFHYFLILWWKKELNLQHNLCKTMAFSLALELSTASHSLHQLLHVSKVRLNCEAKCLIEPLKLVWIIEDFHMAS